MLVSFSYKKLILYLIQEFKFLFHGINYVPLLVQCLHCPTSPPAFTLNLTCTYLILRPLSCLSLTCTVSLHSKFCISNPFSFAYVVSKWPVKIICCVTCYVPRVKTTVDQRSVKWQSKNTTIFVGTIIYQLHVSALIGHLQVGIQRQRKNIYYKYRYLGTRSRLQIYGVSGRIGVEASMCSLGVYISWTCGVGSWSIGGRVSQW